MSAQRHAFQPEESFEETYIRYPCANLVTLAVTLGRSIAQLRRRAAAEQHQTAAIDAHDRPAHA